MIKVNAEQISKKAKKQKARIFYSQLYLSLSKITQTSNVSENLFKIRKAEKCSYKIQIGWLKTEFCESAFYTFLDMLSHDQHYFAGHCLVHDLVIMLQGLTIFGISCHGVHPKVTIIVSTVLSFKHRRNFVVSFKRNNFNGCQI